MRDEMADEEWYPARQHALEEEACLETLGLMQALQTLPTLHPAISLPPSASLRTALTTMQRQGLSCLLVVEHERLIGVFTERDVLTRVVTQEVDLDHTPVGACMTPDPACLEPDDELVYALHRMILDGYRHLPIVDSQGRPMALVSMPAIVASLAVRFPEAILNLPPVPAHRRPRTPDGA